jgi:hypothetical protein
MAKLPMYEQRTRAQAPTATGADFGSGIGQALAQQGDVLAQIGERIQTRNETINRVRTMNQFEQQVQQDFTALQQSEDISDPASVDTFRNTLRERREAALSSFNGRPGAREAFRAQLENMEGQYIKNVVSGQVKAQHQMIANMWDRKSNTLAIMASDAPEQLPAIFSELDNELEMLSPAMSQEQSDAFLANGRQKVASGAINRLLQTGNYEAAKGLLNDPTIGSFLSPAEAQKVGLTIAVDEAKAEQKHQATARNVAAYTMALGKNLTPEQKMMIENFPIDEKDMTIADKIVQLEMLQGSPASKNQINKLTGTYIAPTSSGTGGFGRGNEFGSGFKAKIFEYVTNNADAFESGMLPEPAARKFMSAIGELYSPYEKIDPETGLRTIVNPPVPAYIQRSIEQGEQFYGPVRQPTPQFEGGGSGLFPGAGSGQPPIEQVAEKVRTGSERTIWDRVPNITGIGAGVARKASGLPVVGGELGIDPKYRADAQFVTSSARELIRALSINPRFPVAEMESIQKEINISPQTWTNENAVYSDIVGVDEALEKRTKTYTNSLSDKAISIDMRRAYMDAVVQIESFRETLGVPPVVKTPDEARKLPSGTQFRTPDGRILINP